MAVSSSLSLSPLEWIVLYSCFAFMLSSAERYTFEVDDIAILPCNLPVYDTDKYWHYTGGVNGNARMYLSMNDHVYYSHIYVMERFGRRITVRNDTDISNRPTYDLVIRNLSYVDIGEYRCGYIGEDRVISWVDIHHINVSEIGVYDVECALHGPLAPTIGSTVEFYCEIPPQTIYPQKQVELVWYKNNKTLFMSAGLFAPSLAIRLQRTLIESDFGSDFTCIAYDEFYNLKGQCSVSTFEVPINVTVRLLASQEDVSPRRDVSLICTTSGLPGNYLSSGELQFSWYLASHQIYPVTRRSETGESYDSEVLDPSLKPDKNSATWRFDERGEVLTLTRYHSNLNNSFISCGARNSRDITMSMPFLLRFPADPAKVIPSGDYENSSGANDGGVWGPSDQPPHHKGHNFNTFLAIFTFLFGILVSLCLAAVYVIFRRRRGRHPGTPADELRWMPIHATVVDHSGVDSFIKRHYFKKPPKRLNVQERLNHRSGGEYPISPTHAHQVCLRNKLQDVKRGRKSRSVSEDMFSFPLSFEEIPEFRGSKSSALHNLSRSSSLRNFQLELPSGKGRYVNLPSEYATPIPQKNETSNNKPNKVLAPTKVENVSPSTQSSANPKAGKTVTYAELDLAHLNSIPPAPNKSRDATTYAKISHVLPDRVKDEPPAVNSGGNSSENNSENNFI